MQVKKTYVFDVDFEQEENGFWSVDIPALGVCAASGHTREEALENLQDLSQNYLEVLLEYGDALPKGIDICEMAPGSEPSHSTTTISVSV